MPQSLCYLYGHMIFSTKNRYPFLAGDARDQVHAYMAGILRNMKCLDVQVGGVADHAHVVCNLSKFHSAVDLLEAVKKDSSKHAKTLGSKLAKFQWQAGYGLFSVSPADLQAAKDYVGNQEEHHHTMTFQEELRRFLTQYGVDDDERYVWD